MRLDAAFHRSTREKHRDKDKKTKKISNSTLFIQVALEAISQDSAT